MHIFIVITKRKLLKQWIYQLVFSYPYYGSHQLARWYCIERWVHWAEQCTTGSCLIKVFLEITFLKYLLISFNYNLSSSQLFIFSLWKTMCARRAHATANSVSCHLNITPTSPLRVLPWIWRTAVNGNSWDAAAFRVRWKQHFLWYLSCLLTGCLCSCSDSTSCFIIWELVALHDRLLAVRQDWKITDYVFMGH